MKSRIGFVSNSSTTSFCVMGIYADKSSMEMTGDEYRGWGVMSELCSDNLLVSYGDPYDDGSYVGVPIEKMEEDETLRQFRERVRKMFLDKEVVCVPSLIIEGWYDG